jgi:nitrogen regulatory protein PII
VQRAFGVGLFIYRISCAGVGSSNKSNKEVDILMQFYKKKRISIIVEIVYKDRVLSLIEKAGASGYTLYKGISGKGKHGIRNGNGGTSGDLYGNVEIVTITSQEVADRIFEGVQKLMDKGIVLILHSIDADVMRDEYFK